MAMIKEGVLAAEIEMVADHEITSVNGAGAIGTGTPTIPRTYRRTEDGVITTQIKFDITGFTVQGDNADDVIGLAAGAAYIGKYDVSVCGVVFKTALSCVESPGEGVATITQDLDITSNASAMISGYSKSSASIISYTQ